MYAYTRARAQAAGAACLVLQSLSQLGAARARILERDGVKLLGSGELKAKLQIEVFHASKSAVAAVEKAGGSVKTTRPEAAAASA